MKILSFNLRNWTRDKDGSSPYFWKTRFASVEKMVRALSPDILCLQECLPPVTQYLKKLGYRKAGCGISHITLVKKGIYFKHAGFTVHTNWVDVDGIRIINVHSHWNRNTLLRNVRFINRLAKNKVSIACGDFNNFLPAINDAGIEMLCIRTWLGLEEVDTFQNFTNPDSHGEIDFFFTNRVDKEFRLTLIKNNYGCKKMSDHIPLLLEVTDR